MDTILIGLGVGVAGVIVAILLIAVLISSLYRKVEQGKALVVSTTRKVVVTFTGKLVIPVIHKAETMDISVKTIEIDRRAAEGLICQDNIRADIKVNFFVRVNKSEEDVIKVAQAIGVERASTQSTLEELFVAKFSEALKTVGKRLDFIDLYTERRRFRDEIIEVIGTDLNGYVLEDAAIDYLEQTPLSNLDEDNILDAQGIRKITELTALEKVATNIAAREEEKQITAKNVETREAVLELERQQADAEARQQREVLTTIAREEAATSVVQSEEQLRARTAELSTEQKVGIETENTQREIDVAAKNRERIVAVEAERVEKARQIEVVAREVETTAARKNLEEEMTNIADLKKSRVAVEKTVAEQEESIATLRVVEDANRNRDAVVIAAEGEAQSGFVKDIKEAEAREAAAQHNAKEKITLSKANLEAADLDARAMTRLAEGEQAQVAAPGLAEVQVREANAAAIEKEGLAEVHVKEADAAAIAKVGAAEGEAVEAKLKGEAAGLTDKAAAMRELEGVGQEFEEFARKLEVEEKVRLAEVDAQIGIAKAQAEAIGKGLEQADIDIIGGTDMFVDRVVGAAATGKAVEAGFEQTALGQGYINGEKDLLDDLAALTAGMGSGGVRDLTISAFLANLMANASGDTKDGIAKLIEMANGDGIGDKPIRDIIS